MTDFGINVGLENLMAMCATFVGTVTYMPPERIQNESYSCAADIWSLGLAIFECGTREFPYTTNEGPINLMLQKDVDARPTSEQVKNGTLEILGVETKMSAGGEALIRYTYRNRKKCIPRVYSAEDIRRRMELFTRDVSESQWSAFGALPYKWVDELECGFKQARGERKGI
ncbi:hypothetical protein Ddye_028980 [Dipteronia dyeriana]|uniref:mitogen-activated protein kinase kinase n=1 Tax=Dipteronia dyeriana TaxID=168575 RepID=A0AAD9WLD1_9ROSI|nr:hypothetical protein Ddye_028980 [Dipteronia dyeriana]